MTALRGAVTAESPVPQQPFAKRLLCLAVHRAIKDMLGSCQTPPEQLLPHAWQVGQPAAGLCRQMRLLAYWVLLGCGPVRRCTCTALQRLIVCRVQRPARCRTVQSALNHGKGAGANPRLYAASSTCALTARQP